MPHQSDWLPTALEPVVMRLARADEAAFGVAQLARAWSSEGRGPLGIVGVEHPDGTIVYIIRSIRPIPPLLALLFSEAINHLRSGVENALFHLVETQRGTPLPEKQAKRIEMPAFEESSKFEKWLEDNDKRHLPELGVSSTLGRRIESLQPYRDTERVLSIRQELADMMGVTPVGEAPLELLRQYSNQDKHRIPAAAAQRTSVTEGGGPFVGSDHQMRPLSVHDEIGRAKPGETGELETNSAVCIKRPASGVWVGPATELNALRRHVADFVLPTLVKGFALPSSLPPQIDLSDNGDIERSRIDQGGWTPGNERATSDALSAVLASLQEPPHVPEIVSLADYNSGGE